MPVDSYRWLPRSLSAYYQALPIEAPAATPWTPAPSLGDARIALVTTAGLYLTGEQPPFDLDRERREPAWGDPSVREIPAGTPASRIGVAHLHYNTADVLADVNCVFPIERMRALAGAGEIGSLAPTHYSFMGFQLDQREQLRTFVPQVIERLKKESVDAVFLTPA